MGNFHHITKQGAVWTTDCKIFYWFSVARHEDVGNLTAPVHVPNVSVWLFTCISLGYSAEHPDSTKSCSLGQAAPLSLPKVSILPALPASLPFCSPVSPPRHEIFPISKWEQPKFYYCGKVLKYYIVVVVITNFCFLGFLFLFLQRFQKYIYPQLFLIFLCNRTLYWVSKNLLWNTKIWKDYQEQ